MKKNKAKAPKSKHIRLDLIMLILLFALHTLTIFFFLPLFNICYANVIIKENYGFILTIIDVLTIFCEFAAMVTGFSIIASAFFMKLPKRHIYLIIYICAVLYRRITPICIGLLQNSYVDEYDLLNIATSLLLDIVVLLIASLIIHCFSKRHLHNAALRQKASLLFNDDNASKNMDALYPFKKILSSKNPLQMCLLSIGILLSSINIIQRTYHLYDTIIGSIGKMSSDIILDYALGYVTDILLVVIAYALSCFLLSTLYRRDSKKSAMWELYKKDTDSLS